MTNDPTKTANAWERIEFEQANQAGVPREFMRLRVHGGWIVAAAWRESTPQMLFVPDPNRCWMLGPKR